VLGIFGVLVGLGGTGALILNSAGGSFVESLFLSAPLVATSVSAVMVLRDETALAPKVVLVVLELLIVVSAVAALFLLQSALGHD
jgi:hypothetical protein